MNNDRSMVVLGAVVGAVLGGAAGYLFLTERGRRVRQEILPRIDALVHDLAGLQETLARARGLFTDGLRVVAESALEWRTGYGPDQSAPF